MKKNLLLIPAVFFTLLLNAQTWTGATSTDWNTAANWTGGVPVATGNVTIPTGTPRYPKLASNVTINTITMQAASQLDVNGFTFTVANTAFNYNSFTGASINNSNAGTDIVLNINTGGGGYYTLFRSNTINDNITFNLTGTNQFLEADAGSSANTYNGNTSFNINGAIPFSLSNGSASSFNGNLILNRTVAGTTQSFNVGAAITGNFSYTNNTFGVSTLGNTGFATTIGGTVNIAAIYTSNNTFTIYRLINQTPGGTINIQNTTGFDIRNDTLKVASLSVTAYKTGAYGYFLNNSVTGNVTIADDPTYSGGYYTLLYSNKITGTSSFTNNGTNVLYDADAANTGNTYNGNTSFTATNSGGLNVSNGSASNFNGNLTVNRTAAGATQFFNVGAAITGNFSYTNNTSGPSNFGATNLGFATTIGGTVNIAANYTTNNGFGIYRLINQTAGGTINLQNTTGFDIRNDTLKVTSLSVTGYKTGAYGNFLNNSVSGNLTIADDITYSGGYYTQLLSNKITGNSNFSNNGTNDFFEANGTNGAGTYNGNTSFTATNSGRLYVSNGSPSNFNGNLTVNRTAAATTQFFNAGAAITGNFLYTNNTSGASTFGTLGVATTIGGTVNIAAIYTTNNGFTIYRLINQTAGGAINIKNTTGFDIQKDTLKVTSLSVTGYKTGAYGYLLNNAVTGNVTIADDASYSGGYYTVLYNNIITGTSSFTSNGTNDFYEANVANTANTYNGNTSFTATNSGRLYVSNGSASNFNGNLTVNRTAAATTQFFSAGAAITGNFSYTNNTSGASSFGTLGVATTIGGTVNIAAIYAANSGFTIYRLINQTTGGTINIQNTTGFDIQKDTLKVTSLSVTGYKTGAYGYFLNNAVTGDVTIADDASYGGGYYTVLYNNIITGTSSFTNNGTNTLYDADVANTGNKYIGNVTYARNGGGPITVAAGSTDEITQNLTLNSASGITLGKIKFNGGTDGIVDQLGTQAISISELTMEKTGAGSITLNDSVSVSTNVTFNGGNIISSATSQLKFLDNAIHSGSSVTSKVVGKVTKVGDDAFTFPVGTATSLNDVSMTAPTVVTSVFGAQYFKKNPTLDGYDTALHAASLQRVSGCEYWDVRREIGTSSVTLTFSFAPPCSGDPIYISNPAQARIAHWTGTTWANLGNGGSTGTTTGTVTTAGPVTNFSPFTFGSTNIGNNPLPITLLSFTAAKSSGQVQLRWQTSNEINTAHFDIEKSTNGIGFSSIAIVNAANVAGTHYYTGQDASPINGINYYRLKMVDKDGHFTYSPIIKIDFSKPTDISVQPNPGKDVIFIKGTTGYKQLRVFDLTGKLVLQKNITNDVEEANISSLSAGIYMVQLMNDEKVSTIKLIKE